MKKKILFHILLTTLLVAGQSHAVDYFTESLGVFDLDNKSVTFYPDTDPTNFYTAKLVSITDLPTDTSGHAVVDFAGANDDDVFREVDINSDDPVLIYGVPYGEIFVGSNGYITFDAGDTEYGGGLTTHFNQPRISGLFTDLHPG